MAPLPIQNHWFLDHEAPFEALIVHGHTAIDTPTHYGNRVNIDSSAAYGGPLTAVQKPRHGGPDGPSGAAQLAGPRVAAVFPLDGKLGAVADIELDEKLVHDA